LDALDEYYESDATAHELFVSQILKLQSTTSMNLFATSRHNHKIASLFKQASSVEIVATETDITSFVDGKLAEFDCSLDNYPTVRQEIRREVIKTSNGM
jgi:hypothetical protein